MTPIEFAALLLAGIAAGFVGTTAGLASLISYPALLVIGLPPVTANVTNTVALFGSGIGSIAGSQQELRGQGRHLAAWAGICAAGGALGAALLLVTPGEAFERVVPFLVALASLMLFVQPRISALRRERVPEGGRLLTLGLFAVSVYGGYGAAAGVMMLALLLVGTDELLPRANAHKNVLLWVANGVAALGYALFAPVQWLVALPLGVGCLIGSALGPAFVRRVPSDALRLTIGVLGLGLAVRLWTTAR